MEDQRRSEKASDPPDELDRRDSAPADDAKKSATEPEEAKPPKPRTPRTRSKGSLLDTEHGVRTMKVYAVTESDMKSMKLTTAYASIAFSFAVAFFGYAADIIISCIFSTSLTPAAKAASYELAPVLVICAVLFLVAGIKAQMDKNSVWNDIEKSTKHQSLGAGAE